jgi:hypothetical protein
MAFEEFLVTELIEAIDEYKEANEAFDNDPNPEYGVGTWATKDIKRNILNDLFKKAVINALGMKEL